MGIKIEYLSHGFVARGRGKWISEIIRFKTFTSWGAESRHSTCQSLMGTLKGLSALWKARNSRLLLSLLFYCLLLDCFIFQKSKRECEGDPFSLPGGDPPLWELPIPFSYKSSLQTPGNMPSHLCLLGLAQPMETSLAQRHTPANPPHPHPPRHPTLCFAGPSENWWTQL